MKMNSDEVHEEEEEYPPNWAISNTVSEEDTALLVSTVLSEWNAGTKVPPLTPSNDETSDKQIICSPLDQRSYKSITLSNGVRVMLISTYNIEIFPEEQDATKTPCQVPEVAEFNKMYLGYNNPAARVKCACPCDERKKCCCGQVKAESSADGTKKTCKNTLKTVESMESTCCSQKTKKIPCNNETQISEVAILEGFQSDIVTGKDANLNAYQAKLFEVLKNREISIAKAKRFKAKMVQKNATSEADKVAYSTNTEDCILTEDDDDLSQEFATVSNVKYLKNTHLRNYPNPPKYYEGVQACRHNPIDTSRSRGTTRPKFSDDLSMELEGTVYLVIGSGYFDDPDDQPGLAHFCEHAVFLGSKKFPEPNQLFKLVLPYNGYVNAYTSGMMTTFTVSSSYKLFPLAVEILGDMVGQPLFPNTQVAAELEALDSEYSLRQDDTPKYFQLIGSMAKKGHVMRKMDSGNITTLAVPNFYRKLIEWRKIYYNPSRMTLAVEAPFPLDFLEVLVTESFGKIPHPHISTIPSMANRHLMASCPFDMKRFHQIYHVPSVYHSEFIALHWTLDPKAWKNLKVKPLEYLGAIISHKADGGLFHYLTTEGLATNIEAGCWESDVTRNHFTSVFCISVDMTEKGFKRQDNILQAIFGYIQMLITNKPQETFFQQLQKQQLDSFHYHAAESSLSSAECISHWMQFIPPEWCLISPSLTAEFDANLIQKYTESLTIESANIIIFSKNYRGVESTSQSMEEFYNTPYAAYYFPIELQEKIARTKGEYARNFTLPPPNPLLLNTSCFRAREVDLLKKGTLLKIKGRLSVSYVSRKVQSVKGLLPQARYSIWIGSPISTYLGAQEGSSTKMHIWSQYLNEIIESKFYHASTADIQVETEVSQGEIHITIAGPSKMLPPLFVQILDLFGDFENVVDQVGFEVIRSSFIEDLDNTILDNRFLAWDLFYYLWTNNHDLIFDHKRSAERMTFSSFTTFVKSFKTKMYIQAHLYGYVTKTQGDTIVNALAKLEYSPIELRQYLLYRCLKLPVGERIIKFHSQNPNVHTSVVINSYQFGMLTEAEEDVVNFFAKTMSDAAFYQLRTEQQLGYIIIIYSEITYGVSSIVVELVTQPKNFSTEYCNECIDKFLMDFFANNLSMQESFVEFSRGKPKMNLPFQTIKSLFAAHLLPNPFTYRKLSIQVIGEVQDGPNSTTKSPGKVPPAQTINRKVSGGSHHLEPDPARMPDVQGVQAAATVNSIEHVRAVKKSFQLQESGQDKKYASFSGSNVLSSKVVKNFSKFKQSLLYYPNLGPK